MRRAPVQSSRVGLLAFSRRDRRVTKGLLWGTAAGLASSIVFSLVLLSVGIEGWAVNVAAIVILGLVSQQVRVRVDPEVVPGKGKFRWSPERRNAKSEERERQGHADRKIS